MLDDMHKYLLEQLSISGNTDPQFFKALGAARKKINGYDWGIEPEQHESVLYIWLLYIKMRSGMPVSELVKNQNAGFYKIINSNLIVAAARHFINLVDDPFEISAFAVYLEMEYPTQQQFSHNLFETAVSGYTGSDIQGSFWENL